MGVNKMTGTPWHIELVTKEEEDSRRDRRRCIYYLKRDSHCVYYSGKCGSSAHCPYYKEDAREITFKKSDKTIDNNASRAKSELSVQKNTELLSVNAEYPIGCRITHMAFGDGSVENIIDDKITVRFDLYGKKKLNLNYCYAHNLLQRI